MKFGLTQAIQFFRTSEPYAEENAPALLLLLSTDLRVELFGKFFLNVGWDDIILLQKHGVIRPSLGHPSQSGHVLEHL